MDLERIKQNLRIRSGRTKKPRKTPKASTAPTLAVPDASQSKKADISEKPDQAIQENAAVVEEEDKKRVPSKSASPQRAGPEDHKVTSDNTEGAEEPVGDSPSHSTSGPNDKGEENTSVEQAVPQSVVSENSNANNDASRPVEGNPSQHDINGTKRKDEELVPTPPATPQKDDLEDSKVDEDTSGGQEQHVENELTPSLSASKLKQDLSGSHEVRSRKYLPEPEVDSDMSGDGYSSPGSDAGDYDLRPPAAKAGPSSSLETIADELFSAGHLKSLLHNPHQLARFTAFLNRYSPDDYPLMLGYLETEKAIKAIEYANAVAELLASPSGKASQEVTPGNAKFAANLDPEFEKSSQAALKRLVTQSLPMYITYNLVKTASECLVNETTGQSTSVTQNLVGGLSEVFVLSDPNQSDNPIVYASAEFYRYTGYGRDEVIGRNCRFLQGPKTKRESPARLRDAIEKGRGISETLLNYTRDGKPFVNVLMIAPLHDNRGNVKYHIGAQIDASGLIEGGHTLDGFQRYLLEKEAAAKREETNNVNQTPNKPLPPKRKALAKLRDLSEMFDLEESAVVSNSRPESRDFNGSVFSGSAQTDKNQSTQSFIDSDTSDDDDDSKAEAWRLGESGPKGLSGKLPGIYETYLLVRPAPSLRIIFASPKMRKLGKIVQSPLLSHFAAPSATLAGLYESLRDGTPVSAKVFFMSRRGEYRKGTDIGKGSKYEDGKKGRTCWISATPLLGSDDKIGVWMIVVVPKPKDSRGKFQPESPLQQESIANKTAEGNTDQTRDARPPEQEAKQENLPIKPRRLTGPEAEPQVRSLGSAFNSPHRAETPIEEYKESNGDHSEGSRSYSVESPEIHHNHQERSNENLAEYVKVHTRSPISPGADRVQIRSDSDDEADLPSSDASIAHSQRSEPEAPSTNTSAVISRPPKSETSSTSLHDNDIQETEHETPSNDTLDRKPEELKHDTSPELLKSDNDSTKSDQESLRSDHGPPRSDSPAPLHDASSGSSRRSSSHRSSSPARITSPPPDIPPSPPMSAFLPDEPSELDESTSDPTELIEAGTDSQVVTSSPPRTPIHSRPHTPTHLEPAYTPDQELAQFKADRPRLSNSQYHSNMMDYLRHPGNRQSADLRKGLPGGWHSRDENESDEDCASPYSVD